MGKYRNKKKNYDIVMQIRISKELKKQAINKSGGNLSEYIRKLISKDCRNLDIDIKKY